MWFQIPDSDFYQSIPDRDYGCENIVAVVDYLYEVLIYTAIHVSL